MAYEAGGAALKGRGGGLADMLALSGDEIYNRVNNVTCVGLPVIVLTLGLLTDAAFKDTICAMARLAMRPFDPETSGFRSTCALSVSFAAVTVIAAAS